MTENRLPVKPYPLGAHCEAGVIRFSFVSAKDSCGVLLYDRRNGRILRKIPFTQEERIGNIYCKYVEGVDPSSVSYQFYEEDRIVPDLYARGFDRTFPYGGNQKEEDRRAVFLTDEFDWEQDIRPRLPYEDCICYCMHVRGFTRHSSSGAVHKGTFLGITEKLDYLKESGITTVELQPAYEFSEVMTERELGRDYAYDVGALPEGKFPPKDNGSPKLNYWGYKPGYYYAPKAGYASGKDASREFKELVKAFHKNGMEIVMQFYFPKEADSMDISEILRFWVLEYHVDGFHLLGEQLPVNFIAKDAALADTKLWYYEFNTDEIYGREEETCKNLAVYRDDYLYAMRKFLKGDENMLGEALYHMRHIPEKTGRIHYFSNYYGFTLADMVSYDYKHNEANGEENRDGNSYNCSWNCGEEGNTRRKKVKELRLQQMKNALCMLMFSQSTPLIFMGDEFGNSQKGNNNPYCQDNAVAWLNWKDLEKNKELYRFWKQLTALRKEHPILHPSKELRLMDYLSLGYPDLSYHGQNAWKPQMESYIRHVGIMYCGKYARTERKEEDVFFYLALNMHWEERRFAMPRLPKGLRWELLFNTAEGKEISVEKECYRELPPRSAAVFVGARDENIAKAGSQHVK